MADYTFDDIRQAAEKKYKGLSIDLGDGSSVELRNILRLEEKKRNRLQELQDEESGSIESTFQQVREMVSILADTEVGARKLLERIGGDNAVLMHVMQTWREQTQVGEATPSAT